MPTGEMLDELQRRDPASVAASTAQSPEGGARLELTLQTGRPAPNISHRVRCRKALRGVVVFTVTGRPPAPALPFAVTAVWTVVRLMK
jgi:hypothetical protein